MLKKTLIIFALLIIGFLIAVAVQPSEYSVSRSATMKAPAEAVFAQVNDFHNWAAWSPWAKRDPAATNTFSGPSAGLGAGFAWDGNHEVGAGSMTITESTPHERIAIRIVFVKPFAGSNDVEFTFKPEGDSTVVTWSFAGKNDFMGKAMCLFMDMDKMIGGDYEQGLANMKALVEAAPAP